jgi:hypothetical protein
VLEFTVSQGAQPEPPEAEQALGAWALRKKEAWEWYTSWDILDMYARSGYTVWQCLKLEGGLVACLYRDAADEYLDSADKLMLDICDRKSGARYTVFEEPCVPQDNAASLEGGMLVRYTDAEGGEYQEAFVSIEDGQVVLEHLEAENRMTQS